LAILFFSLTTVKNKTQRAVVFYSLFEYVFHKVVMAPETGNPMSVNFLLNNPKFSIWMRKFI